MKMNTKTETKPSFEHEYELDSKSYCISALDSVKHIAQQTLEGDSISLEDPRLKKWFELDGKVLTLPGQGQKTNQFCGQVNFAIACPSKDIEPVLRYHNCHKVTCPICYHWAVNQQTKRIEQRLRGLDECYRLDRVITGRWKHIVVSDNPTKWTPAMLLSDNGKKFKKKCRATLSKNAKNGFWGGVEILHAYRKKHEDGSECDDDDCHLPHVWVWGPHCHYITKGFFVQSDYIHQITGMVIKNIKPGQSRDIGATAYYLLTHSAVFMHQENQVDHTANIEIEGELVQSVDGLGYSYVGAFSTNKGAVIVDQVITEEVPCPKCGSILQRYDTDQGVPLYDRPLSCHTCKVIYRCACLIHRVSQTALNGDKRVFFQRGPLVPIPVDYED